MLQAAATTPNKKRGAAPCHASLRNTFPIFNGLSYALKFLPISSLRK
ncbi:hypothetical protein [Rubritalea tangerina]